MVFGMSKALATFQRLVDIVLFGVHNCKAYLDGIILNSMTWEEHMQVLETVFTCLARVALTLNLGKCEFGETTVTYLG